MCGCCVAVFSPCDYISISIGCYNVCLCVYACMCVGVCACVLCLHVCVHVRVYICMCVYLCVCMHICLYVSKCMCVRLCMRMCTCVLCCIEMYNIRSTRMIIAGSSENTRCIGHIFTSLTTITNRYTAVIT